MWRVSLRSVVACCIVVVAASQIVLDGLNTTSIQLEEKLIEGQQEDLDVGHHYSNSTSQIYDMSDLDDSDKDEHDYSEGEEKMDPYDEFGVWQYRFNSGERGVVDMHNFTNHFKMHPMKKGHRCARCNCGIKFGAANRIYGGHFTKPYEYPWMVIIRYKGLFRCIGALICSRFFLTAAFCVYTGLPRDYQIILHVYNRVHPGSQAIYRLADRVYTPHFSLNNFNKRDIAVVSLEKPVKLGREIRPVCLPSNRYRTYTNKWATLVSWGPSDTGHYDIPLRPKKIILQILPNRVCVPKNPYFKVTKYMLCTGNRKTGDGACFDYGAPLMIRVNGRLTVIGILFSADTCLGIGEPGIYASVNMFLPFIHRVTNNKCCFCQNN